MFQTALGPGVHVHRLPPEIINPPSVVISRPQPVLYSAVAPTIDEATLPIVIAHGVEQEEQLEYLKNQCKSAVLADRTLLGTVQAAWPSEERNWRNVTGAGGIQLLLAELILTIHM
jgi:hypothetical protein